MALEIAPAPAKAAPAKPSTPTTGRTESADRAAKPAGHAKGDPAAESNGFMALLIGLGQEPATEASVDLATLATDTAELDAKDRIADLGVLPNTAVTMPTLDTTALPGIALPELSRLHGMTDPKLGESADASALSITDKAAAGGRRRAVPLTDIAGPMGTQQLQTEPPKEPSTKLAELTAARDAKAPSSRPESPPLQVSLSLQAPMANEEAHKLSHVAQAKLEVTDNLVVLSSGLSGAMSAAGVSDVGSSGNAAQFQSVVAQEVAYYVSQDVRSAEMKLEGVGGGPVEVSINMQGQEAQVVFRTDELQTRAMLEGATAQLKDMLQQQGVVLTGVFVGSSGAGDGRQQQERRSHQGTRSETTLRIATPEMRSAGVSAAGIGRTLDLFV